MAPSADRLPLRNYVCGNSLEWFETEKITTELCFATLGISTVSERQHAYERYGMIKLAHFTVLKLTLLGDL